MSKNKRWVSLLIALALAFTFLGTTAATNLPRSTKSSSSTQTDLVTGSPADLSYGRQGVLVTNSGITGTLTLDKIMLSNFHHDRGVAFIGRLINVTEAASDQKASTATIGQTYVYFDLNKQQYTDWQNGVLNIYHYDMANKSWSSLTDATISTLSDSQWRLAARVSDLGIYGLGMTH
jgi:hypothetical protein